MSGNEDELPADAGEDFQEERLEDRRVRQRAAEDSELRPEEFAVREGEVRDRAVPREEGLERLEREQREDLRAETAADLEAFTPEDITVQQQDGEFTARPSEEAVERERQERIEELRGETAADLEAFDIEDIEVTETEEGFEAAPSEEAVQRERQQRRRELREETASDFEAFSPSDILVEEQDEQLVAEPDPDAVERVRQQQREELRQDVAADFEAFSAEEIVVDEQDDQFVAEPSEEALQEARQQQREQLRQETAAELEAFDASDIVVREQDGQFVAEPSEAAIDEQLAPVREDLRQEAAADLEAFGPDDISVSRDDGELVAEPSEQALQRERQAQREQLRQEAASDLQRFGPDDIVIEEAGEQLEARPAESAIEREQQEQRQSLREQVAGDVDGLTPDDIEVSETDGQLRAEPSEEALGELEQQRRQEARQEVAADSPFEPGDIVVEATDEGFVAEPSDEAVVEFRRQNPDVLRERAAENLEEFGPEDLEVVEEPQPVITPADVRQQAAEQVEGASPEDFEVVSPDAVGDRVTAAVVGADEPEPDDEALGVEFVGEGDVPEQFERGTIEPFEALVDQQAESTPFDEDDIIVRDEPLPDDAGDQVTVGLPGVEADPLDRETRPSVEVSAEAQAEQLEGTLLEDAVAARDTDVAVALGRTPFEDLGGRRLADFLGRRPTAFGSGIDFLEAIDPEEFEDRFGDEGVGEQFPLRPSDVRDAQAAIEETQQLQVEDPETFVKRAQEDITAQSATRQLENFRENAAEAAERRQADLELRRRVAERDDRLIAADIATTVREDSIELEGLEPDARQRLLEDRRQELREEAAADRPTLDEDDIAVRREDGQLVAEADVQQFSDVQTPDENVDFLSQEEAAARDIAAENPAIGESDIEAIDIEDGSVTDVALNESTREELAARELEQDAQQFNEQVALGGIVGSEQQPLGTRFDVQEDIDFDATEQGVDINVKQEALEAQLREEVASQSVDVQPADVNVTREGGELVGRAEFQTTETVTREEDTILGLNPELDVDVREQNLLRPDAGPPVAVDGSLGATFDRPSLSDLSQRTTPPTVEDDFESQVIDRAFAGLPSIIEEEEEERLGDRETRRQRAFEAAENEIEPVQSDLNQTGSNFSVPSRSGLAAAAGAAVAVPEPTSSVGGAVALGGLTLGAIGADLARRGELDITRDRQVEELVPGTGVVESELDVEDGQFDSEVDVEDNFVSEEVEIGRGPGEISEVTPTEESGVEPVEQPQDESIVPEEFPLPSRNLPADPSQDAAQRQEDPLEVIDTAPIQQPRQRETDIGEQAQEQVEDLRRDERRDAAGVIDAGELAQRIQRERERIEEAQRRQIRDTPTRREQLPEREFPTGESAVPRLSERTRQAQQPEVGEEAAQQPLTEAPGQPRTRGQPVTGGRTQTGSGIRTVSETEQATTTLQSQETRIGLQTQQQTALETQTRQQAQQATVTENALEQPAAQATQTNLGEPSQPRPGRRRPGFEFGGGGSGSSQGGFDIDDDIFASGIASGDELVEEFFGDGEQQT
jgi:hypothetical protein